MKSAIILVSYKVLTNDGTYSFHNSEKLIIIKIRIMKRILLNTRIIYSVNVKITTKI